MSDRPAPRKTPDKVQLKRVKKEPLAAGGDGMFELPVVHEPVVANVRGKRPDWLRVKLPYGENYKKIVDIVDRNRLHTVCQSARCPRSDERRVGTERRSRRAP